MNETRDSRLDAPQLLVSVRSVEEAREVLRTNVAIVDVKEPQYGSLGAADDRVIREIISLVEMSGRPCVTSAALGELLEFHHPGRSISQSRPGGGFPFSNLGYAKFGLAGCEGRVDWPALWRDAWKQLPAMTRRVAVYYVDRDRAASPSWEELFLHAQQAQCEVLLCDTFDKEQGGLLDWVSLRELHEIKRQVHVAGMKLVLAGSLTVASLEPLRDLRADFLAIRSAACPQGRDSPLCRFAVQRFLDAMHHTFSRETNPSKSI